MRHSTSRRVLSNWMGIFIVLAAAPAPARALPANDAVVNPPAIVMGFVGGWIAHDDPVHSEVQLAARLRKEYPTGVDVETFESYRANRARLKIHVLLDTNHDGVLSKDEKEKARIILYGHSWGGSESIGLAEALEKEDIPVLLTIQVDSVSRLGSNDKIIPANVANAVNFYQPNGLIHGEPQIRAADSAHTKILGNYRFEYIKSELNCPEYPWYDRIFVKSHTQIECDPVIWEKVESLIRANLPRAVSGDVSK